MDIPRFWLPVTRPILNAPLTKWCWNVFHCSMRPIPLLLQEGSWVTNCLAVSICCCFILECQLDFGRASYFGDLQTNQRRFDLHADATTMHCYNARNEILAWKSIFSSWEKYAHTGVWWCTAHYVQFLYVHSIHHSGFVSPRFSCQSSTLNLRVFLLLLALGWFLFWLHLLTCTIHHLSTNSILFGAGRGFRSRRTSWSTSWVTCARSADLLTVWMATAHDYDILPAILVIDRTPNTLDNLTIYLSSMVDI